MSPSDGEIRPSLLDRLADDDPGRQTETRQGAVQTMAGLRASIRRDLETLLNTRQPPVALLPDEPELVVSLANFGLPDFAALDLSTLEQREAFCAAIEASLRAFEPRFHSVSVRVFERNDPLDRTLRLRIDAMVHADPAPEPLVLDTLVEPVTRAFSVPGL